MTKVQRKKRAMTNWYSPFVLIPTAIRVAISTVFGELADRRETIAATNAIEPQPFDKSFDYSDTKEEFWFDFLADTGDGWNSTYAMARLVSEPSLRPAGSDRDLPRGRILFLGGDEVYPTASREEYDERFLAPFEEAYQPVCGEAKWEKGSLDLYAVPGNHDWYDGLSSFFSLFCRRRLKPNTGIGLERPGRIVAGRATHQTRSYFAVKLPGGWWLWASDSQLEGYIDEPQIEYFRHVAREWMPKGSKLILCVATPSWAYVDEDDPKPTFGNFSYLERLAGSEPGADGKPMGHRVRLVLTGDSHHYSRFVEQDASGDRHYITCGGGGAFLHPTHQLRSKRFCWDYPPPGETYKSGKEYSRDFELAPPAETRKSIFPTRERSITLTFWNLAFAVLNRGFVATLWVTYGVFLWLLDFNARLAVHVPLGDVLGSGTFAHAFLNYWKLAILSPAAFLMVLLGAAVYYYASDAPGGWKRILHGETHAALHAVLVMVVTCATMRLIPHAASLWQIIIAAGASAIFSATLYGVYLITSLLVLKLHWNEAFSSFAHRGYKCMLRLRIAPDGALTVFPIGLAKVPFDRRKRPRNPPLKPHIIETPVTLS
jgi:hypothetical protein